MGGNNLSHWACHYVPSSEHILLWERYPTFRFIDISNEKCGPWFKQKFPLCYPLWFPILGGDWHSFLVPKNTRDRLNYFFYNVCHESTIKWKFDVSIIYTQLEIGSFQHFFPLLVKLYGHLPTTTHCVQLWHDLEPKGIHLVPVTGSTWCPKPILTFNHPIMEFAIKAYNKKGSKILNRCRMFLCIISICDSLL